MYFLLESASGVTGEGAAGLFRGCATVESILGTLTTCHNVDSSTLTDKERAVQAFMIMSVLASITAVVFAIIHMVSNKIPAKLISLLLVITFAFALIGLAIFTDYKEEKAPDADYGWAYGLGWFGALAALVIGIVVFAVCRSS